MKIKTILVDDEPKSLAILENKLERLCPEIEIIGKSTSPIEAKEIIETLKPQLVFLDIAMPVMSGFDLLQKIKNPSFEIIFATAFDQYAIDAIRHCAIGYLVKPIDNDDLRLGVKHAITNILEKTAPRKNALLIKNNLVNNELKKIAIPTQDGLEFIKVSTIIRCEGMAGYTKVFFENGEKIVSSYSLGHFLKTLENSNFCLCHKSHLINLSHVVRFKNEGYVELSKEHCVPVSKSRKSSFLKRIKRIGETL